MRNTFRHPRRVAIAFSCFLLLASVGRNAIARAAEPPRKIGMRQALADADAALRAGDFRIIYISGGTVPDYPLLDARGGFSIRELYETVVDGRG